MNTITYYVQRYRPQFEAISKEVQLLATHFSSKGNIHIYDLHLDGLFSFQFKKNITSHHFAYYPLLFLRARHFSQKSRLNHIVTSLGDFPYLPILKLKNTILTAAGSCQVSKIRKRVKYLQQVSKIIVESGKQKYDLLQLGIAEDKIELIYPPVDLAKFTFQPASGPFNILYASCPTRKKDFHRRGIGLLLSLAEEQPDLKISLAWRKGAYKDIKDIVKSIPNINVSNEIFPDMNRLYAQAHCTIIPYAKFDDYLKLIPNSAVESLAAGKPLLVSSQTELAKIVEKEGCGIVFEPNIESLQQALAKLKKEYATFQKRCLPTAQKHFSQSSFLEKYQLIYAAHGI